MFFYKKAGKDSLVNVGIISEEIGEDGLHKKIDTEEENLYEPMIINNFEKINVNINKSDMEKWQILWNAITHCSVYYGSCR